MTGATAAALTLAAAAVGWLALSGSSSAVPSSSDPIEPTPGGPMTNKQRLYAQLRALPQLTEDQRLFLILVAHGESNYNPRAHNDSAGERAASRVAYGRIAAKLDTCGRPRAEFEIGSGGRFGRLIPYFVNDLWGVRQCIDPQEVFGAFWDIPSAIRTCHALQGYASYTGTVGSLRAGFGTPGWMDAPPADKLAKWRRHANEARLMGAGVNGGAFIDRNLTRFPGGTTASLQSIVETLQAFAGGGAVS